MVMVVVGHGEIDRVREREKVIYTNTPSIIILFNKLPNQGRKNEL
jgi:hypothetical protein